MLQELQSPATKGPCPLKQSGFIHTLHVCAGNCARQVARPRRPQGRRDHRPGAGQMTPFIASMMPTTSLQAAGGFHR